MTAPARTGTLSNAEYVKLVGRLARELDGLCMYQIESALREVSRICAMHALFDANDPHFAATVNLSMTAAAESEESIN